MSLTRFILDEDYRVLEVLKEDEEDDMTTDLETDEEDQPEEVDTDSEGGEDLSDENESDDTDLDNSGGDSSEGEGDDSGDEADSEGEETDEENEKPDLDTTEEDKKIKLLAKYRNIQSMNKKALDIMEGINTVSLDDSKFETFKEIKFSIAELNSSIKYILETKFKTIGYDQLLFLYMNLVEQLKEISLSLKSLSVNKQTKK